MSMESGNGTRVLPTTRGFPAPPLPDDLVARLGMLEDLSGNSLEELTRVAGLPEGRARMWLTEQVLPTPEELSAIMQWACRVPGGVAVILRAASGPWPYRE